MHRILKRNDTELLNKNEVDILSVSNITSTSSSQTIIEPTTKTTNTSSSLSKKRSSVSNTIMSSFCKSMSQEKEECCCGNDHYGKFDPNLTQHKCTVSHRKVFAIFCLTSYEGDETTSTSGPCIKCLPPRDYLLTNNLKTAKGLNSNISKKK